MHLNGGNNLNIIKWVETCYDNTNGQIYFYENTKTQVVVCSCLGDIYMYMTIISSPEPKAHR